MFAPGLVARSAKSGTNGRSACERGPLSVATQDRKQPGARESEQTESLVEKRRGGPSWSFSRIPLSAPVLKQKRGELVVGRVDDPLEGEADRAAEQVIKMPGPGGSVPQINGVAGSLRLHGSSNGSGQTAETAPESVHAVLQTSGRPLQESAREYFEPRFGHDFSKVRIHDDGQAAESANAVQARAYAVGQHVVMGTGSYRHEAPDQRRLLAHELTHTIQQSAQSGLALQRQPVAAQAPPQPKVLSDPRKSPRYIDNLFTAAGVNVITGITSFSWDEGKKKVRILIPFHHLDQNDKQTFVPIEEVYGTVEEALKVVETWSKESPEFAFYTFYKGKDGVILPTRFSIDSAPQFHAMWPALLKDQKEQAEEISKGVQMLGNNVNPIPCTELDEKGGLKGSFTFMGCVLPLTLHIHSIHVGMKGRIGGGGPTDTPARPAAVEDPHQTTPAGNETHGDPAAKRVEPAKAPEGMTPEVASFAQRNHLDAHQVAAEVAELKQEAGDPAKVHPPTDPHSPHDAEVPLSDGHELNRDKKTGEWERCSPKPCKIGLKVDKETNKKVDEAVAKGKKPEPAKTAAPPAPPAKAAPPAKTAPPAHAAPTNKITTAKDVISSGDGPLIPHKSGLGQYGIDRYGSFANRPGDKFAGHELLQNAWLEANGKGGGRLKGSASRDNPAMALDQVEHQKVSNEQKSRGLFDSTKLKGMSVERVIELNAEAMKAAGIPDYAIEVLKKAALEYAKTL